MKPLSQLTSKDLAGRTALVRLDCNVPVKEVKVVEAFRLEKSLPTIEYLRQNGARVILIGHLGDNGQAGLSPIADYFARLFPIKLVGGPTDSELPKILASGTVAMLENLRRWPGEKANDPTFAAQLASLADLYVNDAFSVSHRRHASVVAITEHLPSYAGLLFEQEYQNLSRALAINKKTVVILGGGKFSTKIPLLTRLMTSAERIFVVGALANSFFKASGWEIGRSVADDQTAYVEPFLNSPKIILPLDVVSDTEGNQTVKKPAKLTPNDLIVDLGPETLTLIERTLQKAELIIWNGPVGWFELGHKQGTLTLAKIVAEAPGFSIVGGGDTLAALREAGLSAGFGFISTAGGAMLDFLSAGTLPGIEALNRAPV